MSGLPASEIYASDPGQVHPEYGDVQPNPPLAYCRSMIFSENRCPPRIKSGAGFFGIMLYCLGILARSITAAHLAMSPVSRAFNSSGVLALASMPRSA
jgi:hypothetical protein